MKRVLLCAFLVVLGVCIAGHTHAALVMELRPQDFSGTRWSISQGSLLDASPGAAYFTSSGTPKYVSNVACTGYSGISLNNSVWDQCRGFAGPVAPLSITGNNARTIEVWTFNPSLYMEETLVDLSHRSDENGTHFALENGKNWALNGTGSGDVVDWNSSNRASRWVHLVITYSEGVATFYVDGVSTLTTNHTYSTFAGDSIAIGSQRTEAVTTPNSTAKLNGMQYSGYIGMLRIYDNALTAEEVAARFQLGVNGGETPVPSCTISGKVTDGTAGVSGALICFRDMPNSSSDPLYVATTDSDGNYSQLMPAGSWYVSATAGRYTPNPSQDTYVTVGPDNASNIDFVLTDESAPMKLIDLDADDLMSIDNDPLNSWVNDGTLGGSFFPIGTNPDTRPIIQTVLGRKCVQFDGVNDALQLRDQYGNAIPAPVGITGNSDWTVSGWYLNPSLLDHECYLSWANTNNWWGARCALMYGSNTVDGAVAHGDGPLWNYGMGLSPLPTSSLWHHFAVTFDGATEKVYVDGAIIQAEVKNLRIASGEPIFIGCAYGNSRGELLSTFFGGLIARLAVYDSVLSDSEIRELASAAIYRISGKVISTSGEALERATIYLKQSPSASVNALITATTDAQGNYSQAIPPGIWYVAASKSRYSPHPAPDQQISITNSDVQGVDFTLTPDSSLHKLIDLDASGLADGPLSSWANSGSLGGAFEQDGSDQATNPTVTTVAGKTAVSFDGINDKLKASFLPSADMTGSSDWTLVAMVYNPEIATEEVCLSWAQRGTTGRAAEFSYGTEYSMVHHVTDLRWSRTPVAGCWHQVAVTYDGSLETLYVDGVANSQASVPLDIWISQPTFLGVAYEDSAGSMKLGWFSGSIASLQVYNECLSESEIRSLATVTVTGKITDGHGAPVPGAVVGVKRKSRTHAGLATAATADADVYAVADPLGNYTVPLLQHEEYYLAAWKDSFAPSDDILVNADTSKTLNLVLPSQAGLDLASGRTSETGQIYASRTGLEKSANINNVFDGEKTSFFAWEANTVAPRELAVDISDQAGNPRSVNGVTCITNTGCAYDWELWIEDSAPPIVNGEINANANWTKIYQTRGSFGGYDKTDISNQVVNPVRFSPIDARGILFRLLSSQTNGEKRPYEYIVHSSAAPTTIGVAKNQLNGNPVVLVGKCVTFAPRNTNGQRSTDYYYAEDLDRTSGIRVHNLSSTTDNLRVNDIVTISGTMMNDANTGEPYVEAPPPTGTPSMGIMPFYMTTQSMQENPNAIGLLVKTSGRVKEVASDGSWFIISDGYTINRAEEGTKVYVSGAQLPANLASVGQYIIVTGVVSRENTGNGARSIILLFNYRVVASESGSGITFFAVSDTHYGKSTTIDATNHATIDCINALPGTPYPSEIGGVVGSPFGVVMIGDLTENATIGDWNSFSADYGVNGEGRSRYYAYEGLGNHDGNSSGVIAQGIRARNMIRRSLSKISANGLHYSWDRGDVHFVNCNNVPTDITEGGDAIYTLQFLKEDLAECVGSSGRPVVIFQHVEPGNPGWTSTQWNNYYNAIKNYNVIAIIHGHTHRASHYTWNGIDVFEDGAAQFDPYPGRFLVFRITENQLSAAVMYYDRWEYSWDWTQHWTIPITTPSAAAPVR